MQWQPSQADVRWLDWEISYSGGGQAAKRLRQGRCMYQANVEPCAAALVMQPRTAASQPSNAAKLPAGLASTEGSVSVQGACSEAHNHASGHARSLVDYRDFWLSAQRCSIAQAALCHANASKVSAEAEVYQGGCSASQKVNAGVTGGWTKTADGQNRVK